MTNKIDLTKLYLVKLRRVYDEEDQESLVMLRRGVMDLVHQVSIPISLELEYVCGLPRRHWELI